MSKNSPKGEDRRRKALSAIEHPFEIVDKDSCPRRESWGKWRSLFDPLPYDKAIRFLCPSMEEARWFSRNIASSIRQDRVDYRLTCRVALEKELIFVYFWKVPRRAE